MKKFKLLVIALLLFSIAFEAQASSTTRINPADLIYLGAFRLPSGYDYSGQRLTINPAGNNGNGSLFIVNGTDGSEGGAYGRYVVEVSIPRRHKLEMPQIFRELQHCRLEHQI
jgi:hypothetical protein